MPRNATANKKVRREKFDLQDMINRSRHEQITKIMEILLEIDGYVENLPALSSSIFGLHLHTMSVQLEEHRRWCEWMTKPPDVQAEAGDPEGGASPASDVRSTDPAADTDPALPNPPL
jgi:hypothetical protein